MGSGGGEDPPLGSGGGEDPPLGCGDSKNPLLGSGDCKKPWLGSGDRKKPRFGSGDKNPSQSPIIRKPFGCFIFSVFISLLDVTFSETCTLQAEECIGLEAGMHDKLS